MDITQPPGGVSTGTVASYVSRPLRAGGTFYYSPVVTATASTVLIQGTLYAMPFLVPVSTTFVSMGVVTLGVALSSAELGIYRDANGVPNVLVLDAGNVATTAAGFQTIAISQLLSAGWYWLACSVEGAAGNLSTTSAYTTGGVPVSAPYSAGRASGYSRTGVSGALPAPWGGVITETVDCPIVYIAPQ
jgi:hypothetical protein